MLSRIDLKLVLPVLLLVAIGNISLSSISPASFPSQFLFLIFALLSFLIFTWLDERTLRLFAPIFYAVTVVLLVMTEVFGVLSRGSVRWIQTGALTLQPSEVVKPLLIIFFAWFVSRSASKLRFLQAAGLFSLPLILILIQPDLGSGLVITAAFCAVVFMSGISLRLILLGTLLSGALLPLGWHFLAQYQQARILSYINPGSDPLGAGYNSIQAMIAVGSGGFLGRGLGQGTQSQLLFLPERHTDFIFASVSEELGFIGAGLLILSFGLILFRIINLLKETQDTFDMGLLGGAFAAFFAQTVINIGMNLGLLPITGIPLPFVSSGGSSLVAMAALLGLASSVGARLKSSHNLGIL